MALNINAPKNQLLKPFFIILVIIVIPFALFFSLLRMPFAKRRTNRLPEIFKNDWLPRKKYVYLGLTNNFLLTDYIKEKILPSYGNHIIWDEWIEDQHRWNSSEPDNNRRVTTFWQDIGGDFDGDPMIIVATYKPNNLDIGFGNNNFYQFMLDEDNEVVNYDGKNITVLDAQKKIEDIIDQAINTWG